MVTVVCVARIAVWTASFEVWRLLQGTLMKLPEHEVKMALDPAAVSFSATHNGQVLVVEQAVARE